MAADSMLAALTHPFTYEAGADALAFPSSSRLKVRSPAAAWTVMTRDTGFVADGIRTSPAPSPEPATTPVAAAGGSGDGCSVAMSEAPEAKGSLTSVGTSDGSFDDGSPASMPSLPGAAGAI